MVGLSEKQHLAEAPWQRRTVGVPWQRRLAEVLGGACPHGTHPWHPWPTVDVPMAEATAPTVGVPWQRRLAPTVGVPMAEAPGVRRWVSPWQRRRLGRGAWRSTVGVPMAAHGLAPIAAPPWPPQRWMSPGRGKWQRPPGRGRSAWQRRRWVSPWQRPTVGVAHGRGARRRWVSHTWRRIRGGELSCPSSGSES